MNRKSNSHKWLGVCILLKPNIKVYVNKGSHTNQYSINLISCEVKFVAYRKWTLAYKNGRCCCQQHESPWVNVFIYLSTLLNVISIYVCERVDYTRTVCCFIIYDLHLFGKCSYKIQLWIGRKEGNFSRWKVWMWCRENNSHEISISWLHIKYNHKCEFYVVSMECGKKSVLWRKRLKNSFA